MEKEAGRFHRKSYRLKGYDYSAGGYYFVTICTKYGWPYFGEIINQQMEYFLIGEITKQFWSEIPKHYPFVQLDEFIVMPNNIHGIVIIDDMVVTHVGTHNCASLRGVRQRYNKFGPQSKNLAAIIRAYKSTVKRFANQNKIEFFWQPRYYDRIIRNDEELNRIRAYIQNNPINWFRDRNNLENKKATINLLD